MVSGGKTPLILYFSMRLRLLFNFTHRPLYPWRTSPVYKSTEVWVRFRAVALDAVEKKKICFPCKELNHGPAVVNSIA